MCVCVCVCERERERERGVAPTDVVPVHELCNRNCFNAQLSNVCHLLEQDWKNRFNTCCSNGCHSCACHATETILIHITAIHVAPMDSGMDPINYF